jgi:ubiquitin-conjugating enzyme E2 W
MPPGITLIERNDSVAGDWFVDIQVLDDNPLYKNQVYRLKFHFPKMYPIGSWMDSPYSRNARTWYKY